MYEIFLEFEIFFELQNMAKIWTFRKGYLQNREIEMVSWYLLGGRREKIFKRA